MTDAKFTRNAPSGCGLTSSITDRDFRAVTTGEPARLIPARCLLQAVGHGGGKTKDGAKHHVVYEIVRLEPASDAHDADNLTWEIAHSYEARTYRGGQTELPLANSPTERKSSLLEAIADWQKKQELSTKELDEKWLLLFGGKENAASETVENGSLLNLEEFARYVGAVEDPVASKDDDDEDDAA